MATCLLMTGKIIQSWPHPSLMTGGTETQPSRWACLFGPVLSGGHPWTSSPSVWSTNQEQSVNSSISKIRQQWGDTKVNESEGATETGSEVWQRVTGGLRHRKAIFQSTHLTWLMGVGDHNGREREGNFVFGFLFKGPVLCKIHFINVF